MHTLCPGRASSYYSLELGGKSSKDGVWYYPEPKDAAAQIRGRVAFWKAIEVTV